MFRLKLKPSFRCFAHSYLKNNYLATGIERKRIASSEDVETGTNENKGSKLVLFIFRHKQSLQRNNKKNEMNVDTVRLLFYLFCPSFLGTQTYCGRLKLTQWLTRELSNQAVEMGMIAA